MKFIRMEHEDSDNRLSRASLNLPNFNAVLAAHISCMIVSHGFVTPIWFVPSSQVLNQPFLTHSFALICLVFGLIRSRWHVSTQVFGTILACIGFFLGVIHEVATDHHQEHSHRNPQSSFAWVMFFALVLQGSCGRYLKCHKQPISDLRKSVKKIHKYLGTSTSISAYIQMELGAIVYYDMCKEDHLGQCLAHFIMGSSFVAYGIVLLIVARAGNKYM
ncbi:hypothetical protein K7432_007985 [Basidiobolus ranarum]|uniref:Cytochrome b561 domain-containing protein n=1 Tax=Basidiobolus ranarum TaxID=34480 RepID=A0ABR2VZB4_9FUNG